jgi:hypothetical protein
MDSPLPAPAPRLRATTRRRWSASAASFGRGWSGKIQAGAALVQIYTSFIYQGPKRVPALARAQ